MDTGPCKSLFYIRWLGVLSLLVSIFSVACERSQSPVGPSQLRGRIVFNKTENFITQIFVMFADDTSNPRRIINSRTEDIAPRWSPDGTQIAFLSDREGNPGFFRLYIMNADGSNIRGLFDPIIHPEGDLEFTWSPDGKFIALLNRVLGRRSDVRQLYILNVETLERQWVVPSIINRFSPDWSPDGTRIAFVSDSPNTIPALNILSYPGLVSDKVDVGLGRMIFPRWSPDGSKLAFYGAPDDITPYQIFLAEGRDLTVRQISAIEDGIPLPSPLTWSPDGQRILFTAPGTNIFIPNNRDLYSIHIDGTSFTRVTTNPSDETAPDWTQHE